MLCRNEEGAAHFRFGARAYAAGAMGIRRNRQEHMLSPPPGAYARAPMFPPPGAYARAPMFPPPGAYARAPMFPPPGAYARAPMFPPPGAYARAPKRK